MVQSLEVYQKILAGSGLSLEERRLLEARLCQAANDALRLSEQVSDASISKIDQKEKGVLIKAGASIHTLVGETIRQQRAAERPIRIITTFTEESAELKKLVDCRSRLTEVAIFRDPEKFLVPGTGNKSLEDQKAAIAEDTHCFLRVKLGLEGVEFRLGKAPDLTELSYRHFDRGRLLGQAWYLFGKDYGWVYGRTETEVNDSGSLLACVGSFDIDEGLSVVDSRADWGSKTVWVPRVVFPKAA